ncbi:hypothetical protein JOC95_000347 [Bacillus tianshenii]|uniref:Uncharacterized protein n=1 Tax=Sutcliffiella tianshenii TaxID=1463404 RepID=A0ABS2NV17_9BACI|nr:hypothetical protein [Bacillus tianshenii]
MSPFLGICQMRMRVERIVENKEEIFGGAFL